MTTTLDHLVIMARDITASRDFYADVLPLIGFRLVRPDIWVNDAGLHIQLKAATEGSRPYERRGPGLNHFGFAVATAADVIRVREAMIARGHAVQPIQDLGGVQALFMPDPDGLRVEVSWYPPGANVVD